MKVGGTGSRKISYLIAALLGAIGGGLVVVISSRAIPKLISFTISEMMRNMMATMSQGNCSPAEM